SFDAELASLPDGAGAYSPVNGGQILLARSASTCASASNPITSTSASVSALDVNDDIKRPEQEEENNILGCVALRALPPSSSSGKKRKTCEMKRLYITPPARGMGLGTALARAIIKIAKEEYGYEVMKLDTLSSMTAARGLYGSLGFVGTEPYNETPIKETMYFEKVL
ncbi:MAG: hypothetical protein Q9216_003865, partial [Gyalolechia sp. 2 TL-2023]